MRQSRIIRHGMSHTSEYATWSSMIQRCENTNYVYYRHYGGRGITVCESWRNSFKQFAGDMGKKPSAEYSIERVDNDKGYTPGNCIWATRIDQNRNKRVPVNSTTGYKGVALLKGRGRYMAHIKVGGVKHNLGIFKNIEDAIAKRTEAELAYWK